MNADQFDAAELAQHQQRNGAVNTSGLAPVEYKVLIQPEDVEKVSAGGIVMATTTTDRDRMAQVKGRLVAVGGSAFTDWGGLLPKVGDSVYYAKYAGLMVKGEDGKEYRLANDKDITAIIERKEGAA